jgi:hypothetical protein
MAFCDIRLCMDRYILRYRGAGPKPEKDLLRVRDTVGITVLDETARMLLVEGDQESVAQLRDGLSDWLVTPQTTISVPDTRHRIKRSID